MASTPVAVTWISEVVTWLSAVVTRLSVVGIPSTAVDMVCAVLATPYVMESSSVAVTCVERAAASSVPVEAPSQTVEAFMSVVVSSYTDVVLSAYVVVSGEPSPLKGVVRASSVAEETKSGVRTVGSYCDVEDRFVLSSVSLETVEWLPSTVDNGPRSVSISDPVGWTVVSIVTLEVCAEPIVETTGKVEARMSGGVLPSSEVTVECTALVGLISGCIVG